MNELSAPKESDNLPLIGVVGVCAAGKSTLIAGLKENGHRVKHIAQEHSYVQNMWKRITNPDILIFLDVSFKTTLERRQLYWAEKDWLEQQNRLRHAREHADLLIFTDNLSKEEVLQQALSFIEALNYGEK